MELPITLSNASPTRVILVRHGQSSYNAQGRFQGRSDESVLTDVGRLAAYQTGIALSQTPVDAVYTSPLRRTQETAQEILAAWAAMGNSTPTPQIHAQLQEIDLPEWQGLNFKHVRETLSEAYQVWRQQPHNFQMPRPNLDASQADTVVAVVNRPQLHPFYPVRALFAQARQFWHDVLPRHRGETLLLVSHGGTIRALIASAIGIGSRSDSLAQEAHFHVLQQSNAGVSCLNFLPGQPFAELQGMNTTQHLGEVLPKLKDGKQGLRLLLVPTPINERALSHLTERLHQVPIQFCLTSHPEATQAAALILAKHQTSPVHLQVNHDHFLPTWHQTIQTRCYQPTDVCTGVVIADAQSLQAILAEVLNLSAPVLKVNPGTITSLYYPTTANHPVLQTFNFAEIPFG
jgi:phosphoserine phosphatase